MKKHNREELQRTWKRLKAVYIVITSIAIVLFIICKLNKFV